MEPTDRTPAQVHAAEVRRRIAALPRWGWGDRQAAIAAVTEAGEIYAGQHAADVARLTVRATRAHEDGAIRDVLRRQLADAQAERDEALRKLAGLDATEAQLRAECEELNRQVAERTAERDEAIQAKGVLSSRLADASAEIERVTGQLAEAFKGRHVAEQRLADVQAEHAKRDAAHARALERVTGRQLSAAALPVIVSLPANCSCRYSVAPDGSFARDWPNPVCVVDHGDVKDGGATQAPAAEAVLKPRGRSRRPVGQETPGTAAALTAPSLGTEESGFAE